MNTVGERLKSRRNELGYTLAFVATKLNQTEATTQRHESGAIKTIPYDKVCEYAKLYGTTPGYLLGWNVNGKIRLVQPTHDPDRLDFEGEVETIAAHHDSEIWTDEELDEIERFKEYVLSKRNK